MDIKAGYLGELLKTIKGGIPQTALLPILGHFCSDKKGIFTFNDIIAVGRVWEEADKGVQASIPSALLQLLGGVPSGTMLHIEAKQRGGVAIKSKRMLLDLAGHLPDDYLFNIDTAEKAHVPNRGVPMDTILEGLAVCTKCMALNPAVAYQMGVILELDHKQLRMYSTDNVTITRYKAKTQCKIKGKVLLPFRFCEEAVELGSQFESGVLYVHDSYVCAWFDEEVFLFAKLLMAENLPDMEEVIKKYKVAPVKITEHMRGCATRAELLQRNAQGAHLRIQNSSDGFLFSITTDVGRLKEKIQVEEPEQQEHIEGYNVQVSATLFERAAQLFDRVSFADKRTVVFASDHFIHVLATVASA